MLQVDITPRQRSRRPAPIIPTLVLGLGDFGREVGRQLAARLMLTEKSLNNDGLIRPLLAYRTDNGEVTPGFVRIMELNWDRWFEEDCDPQQLLSDIVLPDESVAEDGTPPRRREGDRHPDDWNDARKALAEPQMLEVFDAASLTLRTHDTPMLMGSFSIQSREQPLKLRIVVICAAREAPCAALGTDIIRLLGKVYVTPLTAVATGIHVFCYVGGTSREEHLKAFGDPTKFDDLLDIELTRILPHCRYSASIQTQTDSFLDQLEAMWKHERSRIIEACYIIDSHLENRVAAVQQRSDEPDETIVATALALNIFITCNADYPIRRTFSGRYDSVLPLHDPGPFASLGTASYSLDHPKLHTLVYNYVVGVFLESAQPIVNGDDPTTEWLPGENNEKIKDRQIEEQLHQDNLRLCKEYKKRIAFKTIALSSIGQSEHRKIDYKGAIAELERLRDSNLSSVRSVVDTVIGELANDFEEEEFETILLERQRQYYETLRDAFEATYRTLLGHEQAPLTRLYRFTKESLKHLQNEAYEAKAPPTQEDQVKMQTYLDELREDFITRERQTFAYKVSGRTSIIKSEMSKRPSKISLAVRSLLAAPVLVYGFLALSQLLSTIFPTLFAFINTIEFSAPLAFLNTFLPLPLWTTSILVALLMWGGLFLGYRWNHHRRLRQQFKLLVEQHKFILKKADEEARRWAWTQHLQEREKGEAQIRELCQARGTISTIRDKLLAEKFIAKDRVLERIFFDNQLQTGLRKVSQKLATNGKLWMQRRRILDQIVTRTWQTQDDIEKWLRSEAGQVLQEDSQQIIDLVLGFLKYQTEQRLEEIWHDLSEAAALFLRYSALSQDDTIVSAEFFGLHDPEKFYELEALIQRSGAEILNSADRLRWIFLRVQTGLHLQNIKFAVETQMPTNAIVAPSEGSN